MTDTDRDDLEALLGSRGWTLIVEAARRIVREEKDSGIKTAVGETADAAALNKLRQVLSFENGVEFMIKLPGEMIARSDRAVKAQILSPGRRGPL